MPCVSNNPERCPIYRHYIKNSKKGKYEGDLCECCKYWKGGRRDFDNHGNIFYVYEDGAIIYKEQLDHQAEEANLEFFGKP